MDLAFALLFLAAAAANFYFLIRQERVQSLLMLRLSWAALGLALIATAFGGLSKSGPDMIESMLLTRGIAYFFLGVGYLLIPCVVHPIELTSSAAASRPLKSSFNAQAFGEFTSVEAASEAKPQ